MKKAMIIFLIALGVVSAGGAGYYAINSFKQKAAEKAALQAQMEAAVNVDTIYDGITINGVDVGGLTEREAADKLKDEFEKKTSKDPIIATVGDIKQEIYYSDLGAKIDVTTAAAEAINYGREGTLEERYNTVNKLKTNGYNIEAKSSLDLDMLDKVVEELEKTVYIEPKNAKLIKQGDEFIVEDGLTGYDLDFTKGLIALKDKAITGEGGVVELPADEIAPDIKASDFDFDIKLLGTFSTSYNNSDAGRNENLRVGSEKINGTILMPDEVFSMNEGLGDQTYANGYRMAGVIVDGKIEDGMGGGVCQITTTLYNAVILSELEVVERHNHSLAVGYIELGRDAAVAGTYMDLKFKNNTGKPIYIEAYAQNNKLVTSIYGYEIHNPTRELKFTKEVVGTIPKPAEKVTIDPNMYENERIVTSAGKVGYKVNTYKQVYENSELISDELFTQSTYRAVADEVTVGSKPAPAEPVITTPPEIPTETPTDNQGGDLGQTEPSNQDNNAEQTPPETTEQPDNTQQQPEAETPPSYEPEEETNEDIVIGAE